MDQANPAPAEAGAGRQRDGKNEIAGNGRIDGRAAPGQNVAGHQHRPGLVGRHGAGKPAHGPAADLDRTGIGAAAALSDEQDK